jgi:hypothetical protein
LRSELQQCGGHMHSLLWLLSNEFRRLLLLLLLLRRRWW